MKSALPQTATELGRAPFLGIQPRTGRSDAIASPVGAAASHASRPACQVGKIIKDFMHSFLWSHIGGHMVEESQEFLIPVT